MWVPCQYHGYSFNLPLFSAAKKKVPQCNVYRHCSVYIDSMLTVYRHLWLKGLKWWDRRWKKCAEALLTLIPDNFCYSNLQMEYYTYMCCRWNRSVPMNVIFLYVFQKKIFNKSDVEITRNLILNFRRIFICIYGFRNMAFFWGTSIHTEFSIF